MSNESESNDHYSVIGTRPLRPDGVDKGTGRAQYGADIHMPRLAYGKVLRSPHAHANIRAIDTTKAALGLSRKLNVEMPITEGIYSIIFDNKPINEEVISN